MAINLKEEGMAERFPPINWHDQWKVSFYPDTWQIGEMGVPVQGASSMPLKCMAHISDPMFLDTAGALCKRYTLL